MEKWKEEFDYKFTMIGHKGIWGHVNSVDDVKAFVEKVRQERYKEGYERGIREENKEWREGRRCGICGEPKAPDLSEMCSECLETA